MPRQRVQVDSGLRPVPLIAPARPVDTFVKSTAGVQLEQLARGLSTMAPALGQLSSVVAEQRNKTETEAGIAKASEINQSGKTMAQAVRDGTIPAAASPFFMAGLHEQLGRVSADRWQRDLSTAMASDDNLMDSTRMSDFDHFTSSHLAQWTKDNVGDNTDPFFQRGFNSRADAYLADAGRTFAAQINGNVVKHSGDAISAEAFNITTSETNKGTSPAAIAISLTQIGLDAYLHGKSWAVINRLLAGSVIDAAVKLRRLDVLNLLDTMSGGPGAKLSSLPDVRDQIEKATEFISGHNQTQQRLDREQVEVNKKAQIEFLNSTAISRMTASPTPNRVDITDIFRQLNTLDSREAMQLLGIQDALSSHMYQTDPDAAAHAWVRIETLPPTDPTYFRINDANALLAQKKITLAVYNQMASAIHQRDANGGNGSLISDQTFQQASATLEGLFVSHFGDTQEARNKAELAKADYTQWYIAQRATLKGMAEGQMQQALHEKRLEIFRLRSDTFSTRKLNNMPESIAVLPNGPSLPDWHSQTIADASQISNLYHEFTDINSGERTTWSRQAQFIIQHAFSDLPPETKLTKGMIRQMVLTQLALSRQGR